MIVLVCGDRHWANRFSFETGPTLRGKEDFNYMMKVLAEVNQLRGISKIYQGGARGADQCARYWAWISSTEMHQELAQWDKYHKGAGPKRNQKQLDIMLKEMKQTGKEGYVLAFHRAFHQSTGTKDMVERAREAGLEIDILPGRDER